VIDGQPQPRQSRRLPVAEQQHRLTSHDLRQGQRGDRVVESP
jgi:hypothetical protein